MASVDPSLQPLNPSQPLGVSGIEVERDKEDKTKATIKIVDPNESSNPITLEVTIVPKEVSANTKEMTPEEITSALNQEVSKVLNYIQYGGEGASFYEKANNWIEPNKGTEFNISNFQQMKYGLKNLAAKVTGSSSQISETAGKKPMWVKIIQNPFVKAVTVLALSPILTLGLTLAAVHFGVQKTVELYREKFQGEGLYKAVRAVKAQEKEAKHNYLVGEFNKCENISDVVEGLKINEKDKDQLIQAKLDRHLMRLGKEPLNLPPEKLQDLKQALEINAPKTFERYLKNSFGKAIGEEAADKIAKEIYRELRAARNPETAEKEFQKAYAAFKQAVEKEVPQGESPKAKNKEIVQTFRKLVESDYYQLVKYNSSNPITRFIHTYAAGMWSRVNVMNTYKEMGKAIIAKAPEPTESESGAAIVQILKEGRPELERILHTDHGIDKVAYAITHPKQALGSLASEGGAKTEIAKALGAPDYDGHGSLTNVPSLQGTTTIALGEETTAKVNNVYGGSPTVGNEIAPEFLAVIQAAENNRLASKPEDHIKGVPDKVFYTNFQNIGKPGTGEYERSQAIMRLNEKYPLSFQGITLAKDSEFYMMNKKGKEYEWPGAEKMADEMKGLMLGDASFGLQDCRHGFYFPGGKGVWEKPINAVLEQAVKAFNEISVKGEDPKALRGAFQEYVYTSLQNYIEVKSSLDIKEERMNREINHPIVIHSQRACKENIDRGGAANAIYLHTRLGSDYTGRNEYIIGVINSRALGVRGRAVLFKRLPQMMDFIRLINPEVFQENQNTLLKKEFGLEDGFGKFKLPHEEEQSIPLNVEG